MAISKKQPMRPAEIELVELVNSLEQGLQDETSERQDADVELQKNIDAEQTARQQAIEAVQEQFKQSIQTIQDQLDKFEAGAQNDIEVIANANTQITVTFDTPKKSKPIVLITLESTEDETNNVNCYAALTDVSETDFHVRIYNLDQENTHTLLVNWLAIGE